MTDDPFLTRPEEPEEAASPSTDNPVEGEALQDLRRELNEQAVNQPKTPHGLTGRLIHWLHLDQQPPDSKALPEAEVIESAEEPEDFQAEEPAQQSAFIDERQPEAVIEHPLNENVMEGYESSPTTSLEDFLREQNEAADWDAFDAPLPVLELDDEEELLTEPEPAQVQETEVDEGWIDLLRQPIVEDEPAQSQQAFVDENPLVFEPETEETPVANEPPVKKKSGFLNRIFRREKKDEAYELDDQLVTSRLQTSGLDEKAVNTSPFAGEELAEPPSGDVNDYWDNLSERLEDKSYSQFVELDPNEFAHASNDGATPIADIPSLEERLAQTSPFIFEDEADLLDDQPAGEDALTGRVAAFTASLPGDDGIFGVDFSDEDSLDEDDFTGRLGAFTSGPDDDEFSDRLGAFTDRFSTDTEASAPPTMEDPFADRQAGVFDNKFGKEEPYANDWLVIDDTEANTFVSAAPGESVSERLSAALAPQPGQEGAAVENLRGVALEDYLENLKAEQDAAEAVSPAVEALQPAQRWLSAHRVWVIVGVMLLAAVILAGILGGPSLLRWIDAQRQPAVVDTGDLPYPNALRLTGGWYIDLKPAQLVEGRWEPKGPEWLNGTEVRRLVALPWSRQIEAVARSLQKGDEITLYMSNNDLQTFRVSEVLEVGVTQSDVMTASDEALVLIISGQEDSLTRLVVICKPR